MKSNLSDWLVTSEHTGNHVERNFDSPLLRTYSGINENKIATLRLNLWSMTHSLVPGIKAVFAPLESPKPTTATMTEDDRTKQPVNQRKNESTTRMFIFDGIQRTNKSSLMRVGMCV